MFDWYIFMIGSLCTLIALGGCLGAYLVNEDLKKQE